MGIEAALLASAAASAIGGGMQASAAKSAASKQADAARYAADLQQRQFELINQQQAPYREAGYGALTRIQDLLPQLTAPVSAQEIQGLPGFEFAIDQGIGAARQSFNPRGGGSNIDRAAQKFAVDYLTSTAMPQVLAQRQSIYNTLAGIAGIGQTGQTQVNQAGMNAAGNIGQANIGAASALGAGQIGAANAYSNALGGVGNAAFMYSLLNRPTTPTAPAPIVAAGTSG